MLTAKAAAAILGISPRTVYQLAKRGELPHYKIGKCVRFDNADLQAHKRSKLPPEPKMPSARVLREYARLLS